jgi:hypothetical protein
MREVVWAPRWGKTKGKIGFHGGKVEIERPRLRGFDGKEQPVPSWEAAVAEDWLGKWAMNQMLINVATRKFARSVRLPGGDVPGPAGAGLSKSAASRRFVALSAACMKDWMASDLSGLDLLVIQIDGIHMDEDLILVAAIGVDAKGDKHPLGLAEGATENAATVQSLIDNLVERGLDPVVPRPSPLNIHLGSDRFSMFNKKAGHPRETKRLHIAYELSKIRAMGVPRTVFTTHQTAPKAVSIGGGSQDHTGSVSAISRAIMDGGRRGGRGNCDADDVGGGPMAHHAQLRIWRLSRSRRRGNASSAAVATTYRAHGAIREKWKSLGWEQMAPHFPTTGELKTPDGIARYNQFEDGSIYWTPCTRVIERFGGIVAQPDPQRATPSIRSNLTFRKRPSNNQ